MLSNNSNFLFFFFGQLSFSHTDTHTQVTLDTGCALIPTHPINCEKPIFHLPPTIAHMH